MSDETERHGGEYAVAVARAHGVQTMFTLSGAHVFPMYDGAVKAESPMRLVDVRHEQTATFAAEATGKLTRAPGLAVLTAGPGVTNGISAIAQASFSGSPLVVVGGRAPAFRWGTGSLQELDHVPLVAPVAKSAETAHQVGDIPAAMERAFAAAGSAHRGPAFLDVPMDQLFSRGVFSLPDVTVPQRATGGDLDGVLALLRSAQRPVLVLGTDVWLDGAEAAALRFAEESGIPVITNGMGRGVVPGGHPQLVTKARSKAFGTCDVAVVAGTPLDFRLGYGSFGGKGDAPAAQVVHVTDSADQLAGHVALAGSAAGELTRLFDGLTEGWQSGDRQDWSGWLGELQAIAAVRAESDNAELASDADPIHPARIYGELNALLDDDAVVIGDGGDFVSFAGRYVEPRRPGCWLDPGPYGCLGAGLGAAIAARIARPSSQVALLLGDGAAGLSLMDVDTLVRHELPVVMIVGNNAMWGLEKHPMQFLYGYDVAAELRPTRYDEVARALGGAGETVTSPVEIGPALKRAFDAGTPYLVNVMTDPKVAYPRSTTGV